MNRTRRTLRALAAAAVAAMTISLAACTGLPMEGPVQPGLSADDVAAEPPIVYRPEAPQSGATPEQIVRGFLDAATSPSRDWATAREFLTADATWTPSASVQIVTSDRAFVFEEGASTGTVTLAPVGYLDATGAYSTPPRGQELPLAFELVREEGEWRIATAPDGIALEQDVFSQVYQSASLMYWDPSWTFLVPDQRWVPKLNAATWITRLLLAGPSPWLAPSVVSAVPDGASLAGDSVPVESKEATVRLSGVDLTQLDDNAVGRIRAQLAASLSSTASLGVNMFFDGSQMPMPAAPVFSSAVDTRALIRADGEIGWLSGEEVTPQDWLDTALADVEVNAVSAAIASERAAARTVDGHVLSVVGDELLEVDVRPGLLAPGLDPEGFVWVVDPTDPTHIVAYDESGTAYPVAADALQIASRIEAFEISRDGTRITAVLTVGGEHQLVVLGVLRSGTESAPTELGALIEQNQLASLPGRVSSVTWLDDVTVAAAIPVEAESTIWVQPIGGPRSMSTINASVVDIAGVNDPSAIRLLTDDGSLYGKRSGSWVRSRGDVTLLVTQQGNTPETEASTD